MQAYTVDSETVFFLSINESSIYVDDAPTWKHVSFLFKLF